MERPRARWTMGHPRARRFTSRLPIHCASPLATDISRVTMPVRRGARPPPVSRSATCAAWRSIRSNRRSSWSQRRPDRTPRTWLAARMAGCIAVSLASVGSACATAGRSQRAQSRLCSAPARKAESCGPRMSAACTVRTMAGRVGAARSAMRGPRSIYAASRWCCDRRRSDASWMPSRCPSKTARAAAQAPCHDRTPCPPPADHVVL